MELINGSTPGLDLDSDQMQKSALAYSVQGKKRVLLFRNRQYASHFRGEIELQEIFFVNNSGPQ